MVTNCIKVCESRLGSSYEEQEHIPAGGMCNGEIASTEILDKGYVNYGYGYWLCVLTLVCSTLLNFVLVFVI